jgi:hypothetical protein
MGEPCGLPDFNSPIVNHARKDFPFLESVRMQSRRWHKSR